MKLPRSFGNCIRPREYFIRLKNKIPNSGLAVIYFEPWEAEKYVALGRF